MATVDRVQRIAPQELLYQQLSDEQIQQRIELHTSDSLERVESIRTESGRLSLPASDPVKQETLSSVYRNATPGQQKALTEASHQLAQELYKQVGNSPELASSNAALQNAMSTGFETYMVTTSSTAIEDVTQGVVYMAYDGAEQNVYDLATQLQGSIQAAKEKREEIAEFRNSIADWPPGAATQEFTWTDQDGVEHTEQLTKEQATAKLSELEEQLATIGDMKQEWQLQLQDAMNKQQQALQLLSSIMKTFHDTAKAIIQNMK